MLNKKTNRFKDNKKLKKIIKELDEKLSDIDSDSNEEDNLGKNINNNNKKDEKIEIKAQPKRFNIHQLKDAILNNKLNKKEINIIQNKNIIDDKESNSIEQKKIKNKNNNKTLNLNKNNNKINIKKDNFENKGKQIDLISSDEEEDKEKEEEKIENKQKDIKQKTNHPSFPKYSKIPYTLSILLPSSIIDNAQSKELRTYLIGEIARIIGIFKISEIIILHDKLKENSKDYLNYFVKNLQYLETPQYLRKTLFPKSEDLLMSGLMNPLESQHHLRIDEWCPYREGCVINRPVKEGVNASWVNIGLKKDCKINQRLPEKTRLTIKLKEKGFDNKLKYYTGEPVSMSEPLEKLGLYWGYIVRVCENFNEVFSQSIYNENYDFIIGTSDKGENYKYANYNKKKDFKHALIIFGGIQGIEGMFDYDEHNKKNIDNIFDLYLNTCVNQGLRTIRTEEAILISLAVIRPELDKLKGI